MTRIARVLAAVALLLAALLGCGHGKPSSAEYVEEDVTFVADGLTIHGTYRHPAAEILLLVNSQEGEADSQAKETIDGVWHDSKVGDIIFLNSNVPHGLQNTSKGSCTYFAFQFE